MSNGPILIFDKSTLESLSVDESVWLDAFFMSNITPLFFVETLADLEKEIGDGRTPEQVVGRLAEKTPNGGLPNMHHRTLCLAELLRGQRIEMSRRPIVGGAEQKRVEGRTALVIKESPEVVALGRWQRHEFKEVEREHAKAWREQLSNVDLEAVFREGRATIERNRRPRDLNEARALAVKLLRKPGSRYTHEFLERVLPESVSERFLERWREQGAPPIHRFAPYAAHVLTVDLFFQIGVGADLISRQRPSHLVDLAYLYYLPFCMIFTSNDNLHERMVQPFLGEGQEFVKGQELKADLARLDEHYSKLSPEEKERGVLSFAHAPPEGGDYLVSKLWERVRPDQPPERTQPVEAAPDKPAGLGLGSDHRELIERVGRLVDAPADEGEAIPEADLDALVVQHHVPVFKGKWRLVPPEAVSDSKK